MIPLENLMWLLNFGISVCLLIYIWKEKRLIKKIKEWLYQFMSDYNGSKQRYCENKIGKPEAILTTIEKEKYY